MLTNEFSLQLKEINLSYLKGVFRERWLERGNLDILLRLNFQQFLPIYLKLPREYAMQLRELQKSAALLSMVEAFNVVTKDDRIYSAFLKKYIN